MSFIIEIAAIMNYKYRISLGDNEKRAIHGEYQLVYVRPADGSVLFIHAILNAVQIKLPPKQHGNMGE